MKPKKTARRLNVVNVRGRVLNSSNGSSMSSQKVTFTRMTSEEHKNTRIQVYPYLIP